MSILNLLKEKTADEKQNFLNSIRCKASSKLRNTDDNKILDVISIVDAFNSSLSNQLLSSDFSTNFLKSNFVTAVFPNFSISAI